jgi:SAM-dependent methyltransferase
MCDLLDPDWRRDFQNDYDVAIAVNCLHWFSLERAARLFAEIFALLRSGGSFLFLEPVSAEAPFASGFATWQSTQPSQHSPDNWMKFWSRVNTLMGYDYVKEALGERNQDRIDDKLPVMGWVQLLENAGFESIDILLRDPEKVVAAALKPR